VFSSPPADYQIFWVAARCESPNVRRSRRGCLVWCRGSGGEAAERIIEFLHRNFLMRKEIPSLGEKQHSNNNQQGRAESLALVVSISQRSHHERRGEVIPSWLQLLWRGEPRHLLGHRTRPMATHRRLCADRPRSHRWLATVVSPS
jgi:hypothetical protein